MRMALGLVLLCLVVVGAIVSFPLVKPALFPEQETRRSYATAPVARGTLILKVTATGTLTPENQVDVGSEVSGRIDEILVDFNDHVKTGQLLAVINTDALKAQLAQYNAGLGQARASLATSEATLAQTQAKLNRYRQLQSAGAIATQDVQAADADYKRALASVAQAHASIRSAQAQIANSQAAIDKARLVSPIDGVVLNRAISVGQTVAASFTTPVLFTLANDLSTMRLAVNIDEADIGAVHEGQDATFVTDAFPSRRFAAKLVALHNSPKTDNGMVTYPGILQVDNKEGLLRPGLTATVEIITAKKDALLIPNETLSFNPAPDIPNSPGSTQGTGQRLGRVWRLLPAGPRPIDITLGLSDGRMTEVISGNLSVGDPVITGTVTTTEEPVWREVVTGLLKRIGL